MKTTRYITKILLVLTSLLYYSCNDDFLDRSPIDQITNENFWQSEENLKNYVDGFYRNIFSGHGSNNQYSLGMLGIDNQSDNMAPLDYNRVVFGHHIVPETAANTSWNWGTIRGLNNFLVNYQKADISAEEKNRYVGEIRLFRALQYYGKVRAYGDVPWYNKPLEPGDPDLYKARDSRILVMDSVLSDLDFAIQWLPEKSTVEYGRVSKEAAQAFKARICLYEGTFRTYHLIEGAEIFLREALNSAKGIVEDGKFSIYSTGNTDVDYYDLFIKKDYRTNSEVILAKEYSVEKEYSHNVSRAMLSALSPTGLNKNFVEEYLCNDGQPIATSLVYQGDNTVIEELSNRDARLLQTIATPDGSSPFNYYLNGDAPLVVKLAGTGGNSSSGYCIVKYYRSDEDGNEHHIGEIDAPLIRYAEVLLVYAEAAAELGECTQDVLNKTINVLRDRVGMPHLTVGVGYIDPVLAQDYSDINNLLREIRRERRVELALEGFRYSDLIRWKKGKLLEKRFRGIPQDASLYTPAELNEIETEYGFVNGDVDMYTKKVGLASFEEGKHYYFPIPTEEIGLNPKLIQNPNW